MVHTYVGTHEPGSELCDPKLHCHSCNVDEPGGPAFEWCLECGHVYRTARDLRRAYRRAWTQLTFNRPKGVGQFDDLFAPAVSGFGSRRHELWGWLRSRFVRAKDITFCQECTHDF